jgi:DNA polymerase III delta prime subunit
MYVNCAHGKGIKFIRDDVKFFAKTHIHSNGGDLFKSIVLLNADKLTIDAQSALRRLIELFSHNTRFFIIVEEKYKLLRPILSRFCDLYIAEPMYQGVPINLYKYNSNETFKLGDVKVQRTEWLRKELQKAFLQVPDEEKLIKLSEKLYDKGYSALDIINLIEKDRGNLTHLTESKRYELLFAFSKVKKELRNEKLLMTFILTFTFVSSELSLENITFM